MSLHTYTKAVLDHCREPLEYGDALGEKVANGKLVVHLNFGLLVCDLAAEVIPHLVKGKSYSIAELLGEDFWEELTYTEQRMALVYLTEEVDRGSFEMSGLAAVPGSRNQFTRVNPKPKAPATQGYYGDAEEDALEI